MKQIVIATDGSEAAAHALHEGFFLAATTGAGVAVVHVCDTSPDEDAAEHASLDSEAVLLDARLTGIRYDVDADYDVVEGDPTTAIVDFARARDADLIVVGTRGLGRISGAILGSVSTAVAQRADRPVLVAKPRSRGAARSAGIC